MAMPNLFIPEQRMRVGQNLQALGILWCMYGGYRVLHLLATYFAWETFGRNGFGDMPPLFVNFVTTLGPFIAVTALFWAALSILAGLALLARKSWARPLLIGLAIVSLLKFPVGTGLGIYTLWVLAPSAAGEEWRRIQSA